MATVAPFVFLSGTLGLSSLSSRLRTRGKSQVLVFVLLSLILFAGILSSLWLGPMPWSRAVEKDQYAEITPTRAAILGQLHALIGTYDSVSRHFLGISIHLKGGYPFISLRRMEKSRLGTLSIPRASSWIPG